VRNSRPGGTAMPTRSRSSITTRVANGKVQAPVHPGEVLLHDFLAPLGLTQYRLAKGTGVPRRRINEIVLGLRGVTADSALRLARFFGTSEQFWLNLQNRYDLEHGETVTPGDL
jgi:addiction module HigA family antidote